MTKGQKYIDAVTEIEWGRWITYGELAVRSSLSTATGRAAGQATRWCDDPDIPMWRVFRSGGEPPTFHDTKLHKAEFWRDLFERKWAEEGLVEMVEGRYRARHDRHLRG